MDQERGAQVAEDCSRLPRLLGGVGRDTDVQRLPLAHRRVERTHRLLERRLGIEPVGVEDVDVIEPHAAEALVEAREQILAGPPLAVRPGPHVVPGLGRDYELVPERGQILAEQLAEVLLRRAEGRSVVVRQVDMRDTEVERATEDRPLDVERPFVAEVVPQAKRHGR